MFFYDKARKVKDKKKKRRRRREKKKEWNADKAHHTIAGIVNPIHQESLKCWKKQRAGDIS